MRRVTVLLAGGASSRMGSVKWMLPVGGEPVLGRMVRELAGFGEELVIVLPWDADEALCAAAGQTASEALAGADLTGADGIARPVLHLLKDEEPYAGPLAGMETAFRAVQSGGGPAWCLVAAADMPFVRLGLAEALHDACREAGAEAAAPQREGRLHPLFAVYRSETAAKLAEFRAQGGRKAGEWFASLRHVRVGEERTARLDPRGTSLFNMNTPEDYRKAAAMGARQTGGRV